MTLIPPNSTPAEAGSAHWYLVGGGIAALASAVYLLRDGQVSGRNIHLLEQAQMGGSLDASGSAAEGYSMRGSRMFGPAYVLTYDLLAQIPSLDDPEKSVTEDTFDFWQSTPWYARARLIENGKALDLHVSGLSNRCRLELIKMMLQDEAVLGARPIEACFSADFFKSNFWLMWSTMFGFETWHSAAELRRYFLRFLLLFEDLATLQIIHSTRYNGHDAIVRPLLRWLSARGVDLQTGVQVSDLHFLPCAGGKAVSRIDCLRNGRVEHIGLAPSDRVIVTLGSMTADSSLGSMNSAPAVSPASASTGGAWALWRRLAEQDAAFGRPEAFCAHIDQTKWITFTVTHSDENFFKQMQSFSGSTAGCGGLVTLKDSNWLVTLHLYHPPAYAETAESAGAAYVWWGYGMYPDRVGNHVPKKMCDCSGAEILTEVFTHLGLAHDLPALLDSANCIPCLLPYTTSQFMPRAPGDRPAVRPAGSVNLAFVGQYCEIPDDVVYTVEYSVHSAKLAVAGLLGVDPALPPTYKGLDHPNAFMSALKVILK
jgi:oleate hydratase